MNMRYDAVLLVLALLCAACSASHRDNEIAYRYTGEFVTLVDQRKEPVNKKMRVEYALQLKNFDPTEDVFAKYNGQFQTYDNNKHVEITKRTRIYEYTGNTRRAVPVEDLRNAGKLELWITPYERSEYMIEALEIYILKD